MSRSSLTIGNKTFVKSSPADPRLTPLARAENAGWIFGFAMLWPVLAVAGMCAFALSALLFPLVLVAASIAAATGHLTLNDTSGDNYDRG